MLGVLSAHAQHTPSRRAGSVQSQAVALQKADLAQARGFDGTGIKIGAISDSFDTCAGCSTHAADDVTSGDLSAVNVLEDSPGGTDEGRAMLQLIHDIAPGASLLFSTAFVGELDFANQILALRQAGADVIVDDVGYFDEPMYSDGVVAQSVDMVAADGAAYFSSAGNNGLEAYEAIYQPVPFARAQALIARGKGNLKLDQIPANIRPQTIHDFSGIDGGASFSQTFTTVTDNRISFQWDEPFFLGKVKTDFNIYVFDVDGNWMDPASSAFPGFYTTDDNTVTDAAFEFVDLPPFAGELHGGANASDYQIVIGNVNGGPARHIKYINDNGLGVSQRQSAPSIYGHPAARGAQAIAATYYAIPNFPEDFSSPGPNTILFDTNGNRLSSPDVRFTPQLTGADGVDTTFFGFDSDGTGFPNFFGTSAAAPDVAAVGVLALQAAGGPGSLRPHSLYRILQSTATPIPMPNDRSWSAAFAGPVVFNAKGDWVRWSRYFGFAVQPYTDRSVATIAIDATSANLTFSKNPNRFHIGQTNGVQLTDITRAVSADASTLTLTFAAGKFKAGGAFRFGMSVFNPIQGTTEEDPDRLRGTVITVTLDNGKTFSGTVFADERHRINRFTGHGLVNADEATRQAHRQGADR